MLGNAEVSDHALVTPIHAMLAHEEVVLRLHPWIRYVIEVQFPCIQSYWNFYTDVKF
jgi:hypothetical protein